MRQEDLFKERFMTKQEFDVKYNYDVPWLQYKSLLSAVPKDWISPFAVVITVPNVLMVFNSFNSILQFCIKIDI